MLILYYPNQRLRIKSLPVEKFDQNLINFVDNLALTMYSQGGVGLAAPQVDVPLRVFIVDENNTGENSSCTLRVFVNPSIVKKDGKLLKEDEGCLSFPGIFEKISRFEKIEIEAKNQFGVDFSLKAEGFLARIIQHEFDHLEGKLIVDGLSSLGKRMLMKKLKLTRH
jgi:peptide deformylase